MTEQICIKVNDNNIDTNVDIEEIMAMVNEKYKDYENNMDNYIALEMDYNINYTKSQLIHISKYYDISVRKKRKDEIVQDIVIFELDQTNIRIVSRRNYLWECIIDIKNDDYLSKYLNITT